MRIKTGPDLHESTKRPLGCPRPSRRTRTATACRRRRVQRVSKGFVSGPTRRSIHMKEVGANF